MVSLFLDCYVKIPNIDAFFPVAFFGQLDVTAAQLLVNDSSFRDKDFRKQLNETVKSMLDLRVIPIFNENDAISTRRAPYQVCYHLSSVYVLCYQSSLESRI